MRSESKKPSRLALWIMRKMMKSDDFEYAIGDLQEMFELATQEKSPKRTKYWFWMEVIRSIPRFLKNVICWRFIMVKNYLKVALRNIRGHKAHSFINIFGLAIGMGCVILSALVVQYELSFDDFHEKRDRIYRVYMEEERSDGVFRSAPVMLPFAPAVRQEFPEVEKAVRIKERTMLVSSGKSPFYENILYADEELLDVFSFPLLEGNPGTALAEPFSVVITEKMADKYFGDEDAIGRVLTFQNSDDYKITGILKDIPSNSHLDMHFLLSFSTLSRARNPSLESWTSRSDDYTYILIREGYSATDLEQKFPGLLKKYAGENVMEKYTMRLQSLTDVHFSTLVYDNAKTIPVLYLTICLVIAVFILLIACVNFTNLSTARSVQRAKEVGMRKVVGAQRIQLIRQFIIESLLMSFLANVNAMLMISLILPRFNDFIGKALSINLVRNHDLLFILLGTVVFTGLIAGSYPAFILSGFIPVRVLKDQYHAGRKGFSLRAFLVVSQFAISVVLMIATMTVYTQINFMRNKDLGMHSDQIVVIPVRESPIRHNVESLKSVLLQNSSILGITASNGTPASGYSYTSNCMPEGGNKDDEFYIQVLSVDYDFIKTYELELIDGRSFARDFSTDGQSAYLINETAVKKIGWVDPLGKRISQGQEEPRTIIGVIKDFHYFSVRDQIAPTVFDLELDDVKFVSVKLRTESIAQTLSFIEAKFTEFAPNYPFEYFFIDDKFDRSYRAERSMGSFLLFSTILGILICSLGILGLISFTAEQRLKEIGIRKTLGATTPKIFGLLVKNFLKLVLMANFIAWPVGYFAMDRWLENFPYRIGLDVGIFFISSLLALTIALLTISYHTMKSARMSAVEALKYE